MNMIPTLLGFELTPAALQVLDARVAKHDDELQRRQEIRRCLHEAALALCRLRNAADMLGEPCAEQSQSRDALEALGEPRDPAPRYCSLSDDVGHGPNCPECHGQGVVT